MTRTLFNFEFPDQAYGSTAQSYAAARAEFEQLCVQVGETAVERRDFEGYELLKSTTWSLGHYASQVSEAREPQTGWSISLNTDTNRQITVSKNPDGMTVTVYQIEKYSERKNKA